MRQRFSRTHALTITLCALGIVGCETAQPVAWGPTRTERGWSMGAGDAIGASMSQTQVRTAAAGGERNNSLANVRTEP